MAEGVPSEEEILLQVGGLVSDSLAVVSYKWLSRNFSLPSNAAKRLLQKFVKSNENSNLQIVYAISGWSKEEPQTYMIQLVPKPKLEEVKTALQEPPSIHVYSVQRSLPKDPAQLWSPDFVQAEQLFNESAESNNCLRDNRFSAVTCELVHRLSTGEHPHVASLPPPRLLVSNEAAKTPLPSNVPPPKAQLPSTPVPPPPPKNSDAIPKDGSGGTKPIKPSLSPKLPHIEAKDKSGPAVGKRKTPAVAVGAVGGSNSLASMWGRAPAKSKADSPQIVAASNTASNPPWTSALAGDAEARIQALEAEDGSEDDMVSEFTSLRRGQVGNGGGRRRRMMVDNGDDDDDGAEGDDSETIIRLGTPESPEKARHVGATGDTLATNEDVSSMQERSSSPDRKILKIQTKPGTHCANLGPDIGSRFQANRENALETDTQPAKSVSDPTRLGSKRKKVLKTRIDERGREVTEVIWETEGEEKENVEKDKHEVAKQSASSVKQNNIKPPPAVKPQAGKKPSIAPSKSAANKSSTKTSAKPSSKPGKGQGNIMSFFKKT